MTAALAATVIPFPRVEQMFDDLAVTSGPFDDRPVAPLPVARAGRRSEGWVVSPLRALQTRLGFRLPDVRQLTNDELRALTEVLMAERYRRDRLR